MDNVNYVEVRAWAVERLIEAVEEFRSGVAPFGPVAVRFELSISAGNDRAMMDAVVANLLRGPVPSVKRRECRGRRQ